MSAKLTYRAAVVRSFGSPSVIRIETLPVPSTIAVDAVRVAPRIGGVNPVDGRIRSGAFGGRVPYVVGSECAGTIVATGADVTAFAVGDDVVAFGTPGSHAELVETTPERLVTKPADLDWAIAGAVSGVGQAALTAIDDVRPQPGETVVVHGAAGGVGSILTQLLVARGVHVVGTAGPANQDYVQALGASPVQYGPGLADRVREAAPTPVTVSIDLAGSGEAGDIARDVSRTGGRAITLVPETMQSHGIALVRTQRSAERLRSLLTALLDGSLQLPVEAIPFEDIVAAHERIDAAHARGKLVLDLSSNPHVT